MNKVTRNWQLCPKCNGHGICSAFGSNTMNTTITCDVCNGKKIISTLTGLPPTK